MPKNILAVSSSTMPAESAVLDIDRVKGKHWVPKAPVADGVDASYLFLTQDGCQNLVLRDVTAFVKEKEYNGEKKLSATLVLDKDSDLIDPLLALDAKAQELAESDEKMDSGETGVSWVSLIYQPPSREQLEQLRDRKIKKKDLVVDSESNYLLIGKITPKTTFAAFSGGRAVPIPARNLLKKKITGTVTLNPRVFTNLNGGRTRKCEAVISKFIIRSFEGAEQSLDDDDDIQEMMIEGADLDLSALGIGVTSDSSPQEPTLQTSEDLSMLNDLSALEDGVPM